MRLHYIVSIVVVILATALASPGAAVPINYTFSGIGNGSLGSSAFTDATFTIRVAADTEAVYQLPEPGYTIFGVRDVASDITISGFATASFTEDRTVLVNQTNATLGFADSGFGDEINLTDGSFVSYDLRSDFASLLIPGALAPPDGLFNDPSSLGLITLEQIRDVTFSATTLVPPLAADFNGDDVVDGDGDDLTNWTGGFGATADATHMQGDADGDLDVDGADFLVWQRQLGSSMPAITSSAPVPEPSTATLLILDYATAGIARQRRCVGKPSCVVNSSVCRTHRKSTDFDPAGMVWFLER